MKAAAGMGWGLSFLGFKPKENEGAGLGTALVCGMRRLDSAWASRGRKAERLSRAESWICEGKRRTKQREQALMRESALARISISFSISTASSLSSFPLPLIWEPQVGKVLCHPSSGVATCPSPTASDSSTTGSSRVRTTRRTTR